MRVRHAPRFLSWYLEGDTPPTDTASTGPTLADRLARALLVGATVSLGFLVVFGITGTLITAGVRSFIDYVPWVTMVIGAALAALGVALLSGRDLTVALPKAQAGTNSRQLSSMLAFGASYAVASLSCTLPVFLAVVASTFTRTDTASGVATFVAYGAGMSVVLLVVTIALAAAEHSLVARIRGLVRHVNRAAGVLLVIAGGYIVYYWVFNLSTDPGQTTGAGPAQFVEGISADATAFIQDLGRATVIAPGALMIGAAAALATWGRRTPIGADSDASCCDASEPADTEAGVVDVSPSR
ncbi:MAG: cytochrome c biogenesis protein CcdA [Actinobacteria bacterium]|nr:cytochrome c biogenesis protein CcdA [Actinomycetota bacterium]MBW3614722.1 cytochrome c biogenesis protein CcdA [Actinomycetota bacterium]